ncbi:MAG: Hsp70 family protein [Desulfovibrionaceae bacterium]|nr:Hsp70 family protein [Desulfovibrionaceae bacterium]
MGQAIGIDFGTSNTIVSYLNKRGRPKQLRYNGSELIASALYFKSRDDYFIGNRAREMMNDRPAAGVTAFKTKIGESLFAFQVEPEEDRAFRLLPKVAVRYFLNQVAQGIEDRLIKEFGPDEGIIDRMVITVPAKFNPTERDAIRKEAATAMSLDDPSRVRLALEPAAAAVAAMYEDDSQAGTVLVYDFGGGTFDISLIKRQRGVFRLVTADGDKHLGGNNLTAKVSKELLERINVEYGVDYPDTEEEFDEELHGISLSAYRQNMQNIREAANKAKEDLSEEQETEISINIFLPEGDSQLYATDLSRRDFEALIKDDIQRTVDITCRILDEQAARDAGPIDKVVLAGGSSRIPLVREMLEKRLDGHDITASENASTLISSGAALLAQNIHDLDNVTEQVTTTRLGVSVTAGMQFNKFQTVISENQALPCSGTQNFGLAKDDQQRLDICYYEYDVKNYPSAVQVTDEGMQEIGTLHIDLPPGLPKDDTVVSVFFSVDRDGSLDLSAIVEARGKEIAKDKVHLAKDSDLG